MRSAKRIVEVILIVLVVASFSVFAFQNAQQVSLHFVNYTAPDLPLFLVLLSSFVLGVLITGVVSLTEVLRQLSRLRKEQRKVETLEKQLTLIKQQPLLEDFRSSVGNAPEPEHAAGGPRAVQAADPSTDDDDDYSGGRHYYPRIR